MKLGNIFNKKEERIGKKKETKEAKKIEKEPKVQPIENVEAPKAVVVENAPKKSKAKKAASDQSSLRFPHVSEKATDLLQNNQYVFNVASSANTPMIKKAVEGIYGVNVLDVKIINVPRKARRMGRHKGWKSGYKKAIVKLKKGQKIEVLPR